MVSVHVLDGSGRSVRAVAAPVQDREITIDLGTLAAGMYILEISDGSEVIRMPVVKE
jgi:hypothetical protein